MNLWDEYRFSMLDMFLIAGAYQGIIICLIILAH